MEYEFGFTDKDRDEAAATLRLAHIAVEGLFGEARSRLEVSTRVTTNGGDLLVIDASSAPGEALCRIFLAFAAREFGADAFTVRPSL
ncbi:MAG: hypothetical protein DWQ20_00815 [Actinobacteria bacterium]|nr:MAG: hypothetical protein DWQ20_00815 [Actinomycetota bacterium]